MRWSIQFSRFSIIIKRSLNLRCNNYVLIKNCHLPRSRTNTPKPVPIPRNSAYRFHFWNENANKKKNHRSEEKEKKQVTLQRTKCIGGSPTHPIQPRPRGQFLARRVTLLGWNTRGGAARASTSPRKRIRCTASVFVFLAKEWKMLGVPSRRLSRHLSPPPFNVASNRGMKRVGWKGRRRKRRTASSRQRVVSQPGVAVIRAWRTVRVVDRRSLKMLRREERLGFIGGPWKSARGIRDLVPLRPVEATIMLIFCTR